MQTTQIQVDLATIKNTIAKGTVATLAGRCVGGLLVEGTLTGQVHVTEGPLIVMPGAVMIGKITCSEDVYVLGEIRQQSNGTPSQLLSLKTVHLAQTCLVTADIKAVETQTYVGANVRGLEP